MYVFVSRATVLVEPQENTPVRENGAYTPPYESEPYRYTYVTPNPPPGPV